MAEIVPAELAHERRVRIKQLQLETGKNFFALGCELRDANIQKDWKVLGYDTFREYASEEFHICKSKAYYLIEMVEKLGQYIAKDPKYLQLDSTRMNQALQIIDEQGNGLEKPEEVLENALTLRDKDWENLWRTSQGKVSRLDCEHENLEEWFRCGDCGKMIKGN